MTLSITDDSARTGVRQLDLDGRLDAITAPELERVLDTVLDQPINVLVLDLSRLSYISSAGIRCIFRARKALRAGAGKMVILRPQPQVRQVFEIIKAVPLNEVFTSDQELDEYLDAIQKQYGA